jgi:radical SAM superfamily enzyme YgiQ (UPF0313 family)
MQRPILLINAPYIHLYGDNIPLAAYYFPLGIGYIASYLEKNGLSVNIITESPGVNVFDAIGRELRMNDYLLVGISSMTPGFPAAVRLAKIVREISPKTPVMLGGSHASAIGESILKDHPEFDFLCLGEGEITTLELIEALQTNSNAFENIFGLIWRNDDHQIIRNPNRSFNSNIDDLPFPARHLVPFKEFSLHSHLSFGESNGATMLTSRGCPFKCIFCSAHLTHGRVCRFHSEDYVINEIRMLRDQYGVRYVFFEDDTFTVNRNRLYRLCQRFRTENLGVFFGCFSRVDVFDEEMVRILSSAGCRLVIFGIESGVPEILKKLHKNININSAEKAINLCNKYNIKSYASFIVGLPFETREHIKQTFQFGKHVNSSFITFNPFVPFPGTPLYDPFKYKPNELFEWEKFLTTNVPPFDMTPGISRWELKSMIDRAHLQYYLKPWRIYSTLCQIRSFSEIKKLMRLSLAMIKSSYLRPVLKKYKH